jgi:hypothetical protein
MTNDYVGYPETIIETLGACFSSSERPDDARRIRALKGSTLSDTLETLTNIERAPGLPARLFGLVALAKQALQGRRVNEFTTETMRHLGLLAEDETYPPPPTSGWWSHGGD